MSKARPPKSALPITEPRRLRAALGRLDARERRIVELHYGIGEARPLSLGQIGRRFGISGERVRQIETRALDRLTNQDGTAAAKPRDAANRARRSEASLPGDTLRAWTLLMLRGRPAHGYELIKRLGPPGFQPTGPRLYRLLRELEQDGLVRSDWVDSAGGPERRVYKLTRKGSRQLKDDAKTLNRLSDALVLFFEHYAHAPGARKVNAPNGSATQPKTGSRRAQHKRR